MKIMPLGARCFVEEIEPIDEVTTRAAAVGLYAVVLDENKPQPTTGRVVAIGTDPLIQELIQVGDTVAFGKFDGFYQQVEGRTYRCLELRELRAVIRPDTSNSQSTSTSLRQASEVEELPPR